MRFINTAIPAVVLLLLTCLSGLAGAEEYAPPAGWGYNWDTRCFTSSDLSLSNDRRSLSETSFPANTTGGESLTGWNTPTSGETCSESLLEISPLDFSQSTVTRGAMTFPSYQTMQFWGNAYFVKDKLDVDFYNDLKHKMVGGMIGLNFSLGSAWTVCGYYNYNQGDYEFGDPAGMRQTTHLGGVGLYYTLGSFYANLVGAWGIDTYKLTNDLGMEITPKGWQGTGLFEIGYELKTKGLFSLKPYTGLQYSYLTHKTMDESVYGWSDEKMDYDSLYYLLGARIDMNLHGMDTFSLQGRMSWIQDLLKEDSPLTNYWFGRIPGTITPTQLSWESLSDKSFFWLGIGLRLSAFSHFCFTGDYDAIIANNRTSHIVSVGLVMSF